MRSEPVDPALTEQRLRSRLRQARAVATGMLAVCGAVFAATLSVTAPAQWVLLVRAVAEAALVGGLADWFAIVALFRRPLGLPIPHTAILPANRDRIGEGLARFLDRHFLTRDALLPELRSLRVADRIAAWLADRRNAAALSGEITRALPYLLRAIDDRQIKEFVLRALGPQLAEAPIGPLLGHLLRALAASGYHEAVLDRALDIGQEFLARNEARVVEIVAERKRRWIPRALNREIAKAVMRAAGELIVDLRQPDGPARQSLLAAIDEFATEMAAPSARSDQTGRAFLAQPEFQAWIGALWAQLRDAALSDVAMPASRLRRALAMMILSVGEALRSDDEIRARFDAAIEAVLLEALPWRTELIRFVTAVVRQWEPRSFSDRIETAVGADLQYIRINGTIVGGLVGGLLYLLSLLAQ